VIKDKSDDLYYIKISGNLYIWLKLPFILNERYKLLVK